MPAASTGMSSVFARSAITCIGLMCGMLCSCTRPDGSRAAEARLAAKCDTEGYGWTVFVNGEPTHFGVGYGYADVQGYPLTTGTNQITCAHYPLAPKMSPFMLDVSVGLGDQLIERIHMGGEMGKNESSLTRTFVLPDSLRTRVVLEEIEAQHNEQVQQDIRAIVMAYVSAISELDFARMSAMFENNKDALGTYPRWLTQADSPKSLHWRIPMDGEVLDVRIGKKVVMVCPKSEFVRDGTCLSLLSVSNQALRCSFSIESLRFVKCSNTWAILGDDGRMYRMAWKSTNGAKPTK